MCPYRLLSPAPKTKENKEDAEAMNLATGNAHKAAGKVPGEHSRNEENVALQGLCRYPEISCCLTQSHYTGEIHHPWG